jgi:hypothetical protein
MHKHFLAFLLALIVATLAFDRFAYEIDQLNAESRVLVRTGQLGLRVFDDNGLPVSRNARTGENFVSPFYVVHYGLIYSDTCFKEAWKSRYHWREDSTMRHWNEPPEIISTERFRYAADWIVSSLEADGRGNAHLYYHFDWAYPNVPGGQLSAPWWSGLTDGHALTLLLRAADCFGDARYAEAAAALYDSVLTPVADGGSLVTMNGYPWVEEYVDPRLPEESMSRVFNGMVYAFHGVKAYELVYEGRDMTAALEASILKNTRAFGLGYWSYYDAVGTEANIKYHLVNLSLIEDERLDLASELQEIIDQWRVGARHPGVFYLLSGPNTIAKLHFFVTFLLVLGLLYFLCVSFLTHWSRKR